MKKQKHSFAVFAALMGVLVLGVSTAVPQEDMKTVAPEALKPLTRPAASFVHDKHNEKAKLEDCAVCHHGEDADGRLDKEDMSAGIPCVDCHAVDAKEDTPLQRAYHQQCIRCHVENKLGPTYCGGCHKR